MASRIDHVFQQARRTGRKALIPYVMAGDPDMDLTRRLVPELAAAGADIVELGIPFSDPIADGPTILRAGMRALVHDTSLAEVLRAVADIRKGGEKECDVPIVLMSYYNPILQYGEAAFAADAVAAGVDGVIVPDLPPEEGQGLIKAARAAGLDTIFLLAPTSDPGRIRKVARVCRGFIYYVSLTGITGARLADPADVAGPIAAIREATDKPVAVGFGIATPEQARDVGRVADGVIVGSALVRVIEEEVEAKAGPDRIVRAAREFVASLRKGVDG
jgi:tryptophan synthase alpha chain